MNSIKNLAWLGCLAPVLYSPLASAEGLRPALNVQPVYTRDYAFLKDPSMRTDALDSLKYISLPVYPNSYLSLSGEVRFRYEDFIKGPAFGIQAPAQDDYLLQRTLIGADLHVAPHVRAFLQMGFHDVTGKVESITSTERSGYDWQQAFVEGNMPLSDGGNLSIRTGRQEMNLGSQRMVGLRDGPNIRQSFDGMRMTYSKGIFSITAFATHPVRIGSKSFDDASNLDQTFWGVYATSPTAVKGMKFDIYTLHLDRANAHFARGTALERRTSVGSRIFGLTQGFDYNVEGVYQFGTFGSSQIRAWTIASDFGYQFKTILTPRLGAKLDIASGDKHADGQLNTFNALFPRGSYFSENGLIGPANLVDFQPNLTLAATKTVSLNLGADFLWRQNTADAVYKQPNVPINSTAGKPGKWTGVQYSITPSWQITPHLNLAASFVYFKVGNTLKSAGASDVVYAGSWIGYKF